MHAVDVARCLDAHGDIVQVWGCNGHCCLDAEASGSGQDDQTVQGFGCAGSSNQVWTWAT
ncbi:hypothetical protein [Streptomyces sp. NPDC005538]|uniref:hypothetical protein n=1 Tax=unclassified Streptomyces TaxID=2593676 RepID=UPI00339ECF61